MHYVKTHEFVTALKSIGIELPENAMRATIKLKANSVVRVDCELVIGGVDITTLLDTDKQYAPAAGTKKKVRFKLIDANALAEDANAPLVESGGVVHRKA